MTHAADDFARRAKQSAPLTAAEKENLRISGKVIRDALREQPAIAFSIYEGELKKATTELVEHRLRAVFQPHVEFTSAGEWIEKGPDGLRDIAEKYESARRSDRRAMISSAVEHLLRLAVNASTNAAAGNTLRAIGDFVPSWILEGTLPQQVFCKLAIYLGLRNVPPPHALVPILEEQFRKALQEVLEIGAPVTRDIAVEAMGAVLKALGKPALALRSFHPGKEEGNPDDNDWYVKRGVRRSLAIRAIAGDVESRDRFLELALAPADPDFDNRADLLRSLPAVWRQAASDPDAVLARAVEILTKAASIDAAEAQRTRVELAKFARYQHSVFTTIDVMLKRGADPEHFDAVVARAVRRLPPTIAAAAPQANLQARASIAIIASAARIVARSERMHAGSHHQTECEQALAPLFSSLKKARSEWTNPGLLEGALRALPPILTKHTELPWAQDALEGTLTMLELEATTNDLAALHRRVIANVCFRTLLTTLVDTMHGRLLDFHMATNEDVYERDLDHSIAHLLANPAKDEILRVFHPSYNPVAGAIGEMPTGLAESVVGAAASAAEVLKTLESLYAKWETLSVPDQLLLTRILGAELRAATREAREISRYGLLKARFDSICTVAISNRARRLKLWKLLSHMPQPALEACHADLQEFVELLSAAPADGKDDKAERDTNDLAEDVNDLPEYVLAMVSEKVSERLARHIAREVDLKRRRARARNSQFDFAVQLYQVTLRGPSEKIFDHLIPRIDDDLDRRLVALFRRHVASVHSEPLTIDAIKTNIEALLPDITLYQFAAGQHGRESGTLDELAAALELYVKLASRETAIWSAIKGEEPVRRSRRAEENRVEGGLHDLLIRLDKIAHDTHVRHHEALGQKPPALDDHDAHANRRRDFSTLCQEECAQLRAEVAHYVTLPIRQFEERHRSMRHAMEIVDSIIKKFKAQPLLQPPEQVFLMVLLDHWRDVFNRTKEWYVDAPRRCIETKHPERFWDVFIFDPQEGREEEERGRREDQVIVHDPSIVDFQIEGIEPVGHSATARDFGLTGDAPPRIENQRSSFEEFYVDWMASELDVDLIKRALTPRWVREFHWFAKQYFRATHLPTVVALIAIPFALTALLHALDWDTAHRAEGLVFILYAAVSLSVMFYILLRHGLLNIGGWIRKEILREPPLPRTEPKKYYLYQAILPSLFKLIVVPFVLLVEFEHSYTFPIEASNIVIVTLMALAFLTTRYFVRREVMGHNAETNIEEEGDERSRRDIGEHTRKRRQVRQILALALAQAFGMALVFSLMFEANAIRRYQEEHPAQNVHFSATAARYHHSPEFLGFIPREAEANVGAILADFGIPLTLEQQAHFCWQVYPTVILTWTALGLFFGVFLEGFMSGERLREEVAG
jgi:hypothetical protein